MTFESCLRIITILIKQEKYRFVAPATLTHVKELRKITFADSLDEHFKLGDTITRRDEKAIRKTVSGLIKILHPDGQYSKEELEEYLQLAIELRRRVREQLKKIGGIEFYDTPSPIPTFEVTSQSRLQFLSRNPLLP
jgi:predicted ATP-dependent Lon-type protease